MAHIFIIVFIFVTSMTLYPYTGGSTRAKNTPRGRTSIYSTTPLSRFLLATYADSLDPLDYKYIQIYTHIYMLYTTYSDHLN